MKKIGIMGGTFDPIHIGHLTLAEDIRDKCGLDMVLFIPAGDPPHKDSGSIAKASDRYNMTVLGCRDNALFEVSDIELGRKGKTYSVDTLERLRELYPKDTEFVFITGADSILEIDKWRHPERLFGLCSFAAAARPGYKNKKIAKQIDFLKEKYGAEIDYVESTAIDISSTEIRKSISEGRSVKYVVPDDVIGYIAEKGLYGFAPEFYPEFRIFSKRLKNELKPSRYRHTIGVAEEAFRMACIFGEDAHKAYVAGLLHDCAKNFDRDKAFELCEKYRVELDDVLKKQPDLIHSFLGAAVAENEYGIKDGDVLNAIRYHTTGREAMSRLEMIVYLADMTEPGRESYTGLDKIRKLAYYDLESAVAEALNRTIGFNREKGRVIHPLSLKAFEYYKKYYGRK